MEGSRNYILEHFVLVAVESQDLLKTNIEDFHAIISDDELNAKVKVELLTVRQSLISTVFRTRVQCGNASFAG